MKQFKLIFLLLFLFLSSGKLSAQEDLIYLSPGITLGWNSSGFFTFSPKLSLGVCNQDGNYSNITFGIVGTAMQTINRYEYIELQVGSVRHYISGGAGIAFTHYDYNMKIVPKLSISAGFIIFANYDIAIRESSINSNFGLQAVAPIPLKGRLHFN